MRAFRQVDVFTRRPFFGNPVAVILDGSGLTTDQMQQIAQWTNLSETTFVLPPDDPAASYRVRIFTPRAELPFAGHPTLGTAHAVLEAGIAQPVNGTLVQQCAVGLVEVTIEGDMRAFRLPRYAEQDAPDVDQLTAALGVPGLLVAPPKLLDVGPRWVIGECSSTDALATLGPDLAALPIMIVRITQPASLSLQLGQRVSKSALLRLRTALLKTQVAAAAMPRLRRIACCGARWPMDKAIRLRKAAKLVGMGKFMSAFRAGMSMLAGSV